MPAPKLPAERPSAREIGRFLGYLAAGIALSALFYQALRMAAWMIDRGM